MVSSEECARRHGHAGLVIWLTGISGAGKSTIGRRLETRLWEMGRQTVLLDGDDLRNGLCSDLGFSPEDRSENIRRAAELARLLYGRAMVVVCTFISPYAHDRAFARSLIDAGRFIEVHVDCSVEVARERDPKGLYGKAARGEIRDMTAVQSGYETPSVPEIRLDTDLIGVDEAVSAILKLLPDGLGDG